MTQLIRARRCVGALCVLAALLAAPHIGLGQQPAPPNPHPLADDLFAAPPPIGPPGPAAPLPPPGSPYRHLVVPASPDDDHDHDHAHAPGTLPKSANLGPLDILYIQGQNLLPDSPLDGAVQINAAGVLDLGAYGKVNVAGLTPAQAQDKILKMLQTDFVNPGVTVRVLRARGGGDPGAINPDGKGLQGQLEFKEYSRSPVGVLRALAANASAKPDNVLPKSASVLQEYVTRGDWPAFKKMLAEQSPEVGAALYGQVVAGLKGRSGQVTLLPDDVLALADAAPKAPAADECAMLGELCRPAIKQVRGPQQVLSRIKDGTRWLGGQEPAKRLAAARFLIAAGMMEEAAPYLPPIAEVAKGNDAELLNLCADYLMMVSARQQNPAGMIVAWQLTQRVLSLPEAPAPEYSQAIQRSLQLLPALGDKAEDWVRVQLENDARGLRVLAVIASQAGTSAAPPEVRLQGLASLKQFGDQLVAQLNKQPQKSKLPLTMLTLLWVAEADLCMGTSPDPRQTATIEQQILQAQMAQSAPAPQTLQLQLEERINGGQQQEERQRPQPLPAAPLLALAPNEAWSRAVGPDLAGRILRQKGFLAATAVDIPTTLRYAKELTAGGDEAGDTLVSTLLQNWAGNSEVESAESLDPRVHLSHRHMQSSSGSGVPLTRARQVRKLKKLVELLAVIRASGVPAKYDDALVQAFGSCHSQAEVYRREDLEQVFGKLDSLTPELAATLAQHMHAKLSGMWQRMDLQLQNNTNRTQDDQAGEVQRGYELAIELLNHALKKRPENVDLHSALAATTFDQAEFLYGQKTDLKNYTDLRDRAFAEYATAAKLYGDSPDSAREGKQRVDLYARWFSAALGASELSSLTPADKPQRDQIEKIAQAIRSLKGKAADAHLQLFANALTQSGRQTPGQLKPWCFREALKVIGDHAAGDPLRKLLTLYEELLTEIELGVQVDGGADVGADHPFGVQVALRGTRNLHREANNFAGLLQPMSMYGGAAADPKEKLKTMFREQLGERFEIDAIQFHDAATVPRTCGRDGWLEKPLAYLVLRAKTPAVDRIPPLHVDLEFNDGAGGVLLPVASPPVLVSAAAPPKPQPLSDVKLKQTFDDRLAKEDLWKVEVKATATGLATDIDQVVALPGGSLGNFAVKKVEPGALTISGFDLTQKQVRPISQRTWTIHLTPAAGLASSQFAFPKSAVADAEVKLERFEDFDAVEAGPVIITRGPVGSFWARWRAVILGAAGAAVVVGLGVALLLTRRKPVAAAVSTYRRPDPLTPFSLLALLRRIQGDENLRLSESEQTTLSNTVAQLEGRYFARQGKANGEVHLADTLERWLTRARSGRGSPSANGNGHVAKAAS